MRREQVEGFPLPAPVFHDLGRQFHEIPGDTGAGEAPHFHAAQAVMQEMTKLVKYGLRNETRTGRGLPAPSTSFP